MKKICLLLFTLLFVSFTYAQVSITATSGTTGPTVYTTLKSAFDAVNSGTHKGVITITVNANTTETASAVLNASGSGSSSYTSISIKPAAGAAVSVTGNIADPVIDLNGADNITIDGLNSAGSSLTITNTNTGNASGISTIRFINDATANTIFNTTVSGAGTNVASGTIFFSTGSVLGNDNNTVTTCNISDASGSYPVNGIYSVGSANAGTENSGNTISNNNISNYFNPDLSTAGVLIAAGNTDWTIFNNKFFQTASRTFTTGNPHRAIQITSGNNYNITANKIGYSSVASTGIYTLGGNVASRFLAIDLAVGTTTATSVQNNTVTAFSFTTSSNASSSSGIWCAINIVSGNVNAGTVTGNTIGSTTGTGAITINPTVAGTLAVGITSASTGAIAIANNTIGAIDQLPAGALSGNLLGIQTSGASGNITVTNNIVGNATLNNMRIGTLGTTTGNGIVRGILNSNAGTISITGNTVRNLIQNSNNALALFRGIEVQNGAITLTGNTLYNISANGTSVSVATVEGAGILISTSVPNIIADQNTIYNLSVTNSTVSSGITVMGIYLSSNSNGVTITRNKMYGFSNASTSTSTTVPGTVAGIYLRDAVIDNPVIVANNMISFGSEQSTNTAFIGIWNQIESITGYTARIYYNTINIIGAVSSGAQPSFCYYRGNFTNAFNNPAVDIKNNIFTNSRSGGTGKHYAISNSYPATLSSASGWGTNASDYNVLNANASTIAYWSGDQTFEGWKAASAGDSYSLSGVAITYVDSASDLHLVTTANSAVDGKGTPIAMVTNDHDSQIRNATTPDIGADEFTPTGTLAVTFEYLKGRKQGNVNLLNWKSGCISNSVEFNVQRSTDARIFTSIGSITATKARCAQPFDFADSDPLTSTNYYRLKITEIDGQVYYSPIIAIINKLQGFEIVGLTPTLVNDGNATLNVSSAQNSKMEIVVTDISGKVMLKQTSVLASGLNTVSLNLSNLPSGSYQLTGYTTEGKTKTIRFIKQ